MVKKKDFIIISIIALILISSFIFNHFYFYQTGDYIQIRVDNQEYQTVALDTNQTIDISNKNTIVIENKSVYIKDSTCPDKLCQKQGRILNNGQQIICLPNKVVVEIIAKKDNNIDALTGGQYD